VPLLETSHYRTTKNFILPILKLFVKVKESFAIAARHQHLLIEVEHLKIKRQICLKFPATRLWDNGMLAENSDTNKQQRIFIPNGTRTGLLLLLGVTLVCW
jgi:hypothetical protein